MSRNDIVVVLATAGPESRVTSFCVDTLDEELYVCEDCTEDKPCEDFHDGDGRIVNRKAMASCFGRSKVFTDEEQALRYANAPGFDEYDVPQYGVTVERQTETMFPAELVASPA